MKDLSTETRELINSILNSKNSRYIYNMLENGILSFNEYVARNSNVFNSGYASNIKGRMLSHFINMQFENAIKSERFPFKITTRIEGPNKIPQLQIENIILTPKRGNCLDSILDDEVKYMRNLAKGNKILDKQISMFELGMIDLSSTLYGIIAYSKYDETDGKFGFAKIVFPNEKLNGYYYDVDITSNIKIYNSISEIKEDKERLMSIENLIDSVQKELEFNKLEAVLGDEK